MMKKFMICTSLKCKNNFELKNKIKKAFDFGSDYVEIRLDYFKKIDMENFKRIVKPFINKCILTYRLNGYFNKKLKEKKNIIKELIDLKPAYIDIEEEYYKKMLDLIDYIKNENIQLIISWHDFNGTPSINKLRNILEKIRENGDLYKIVTTAKSINDNYKILSLYDYLNSNEKNKLIAFCMGEKGLISRILCVFAGAPFTYASLFNQKTAPGQLSIIEMRKIYEIFKKF
ncbi:MAG: type I 3-dehydroquinate dehydratase [Candidatus Aenigmatarchaeota archaeon]